MSKKTAPRCVRTPGPWHTLMAKPLVGESWPCFCHLRQEPSSLSSPSVCQGLGGCVRLQKTWCRPLLPGNSAEGSWKGTYSWSWRHWGNAFHRTRPVLLELQALSADCWPSTVSEAVHTDLIAFFMNSLQEALYLQMRNYKLKMCKRLPVDCQLVHITACWSSGLAGLEPSALSFSAHPHSLPFLEGLGVPCSEGGRGRRSAPGVQPCCWSRVRWCRMSCCCC